jgi:ABC-2 type transport system permease protein
MRRPTADVITVTLAKRAFADGRVRTIAFAYLFAVAAFINPFTYRHTYPTLAQRLDFSRSFGHNKAVVLFYGQAHDLLTAGGYSAWRTGGILSVLGAVFGLLAAVRALRAEEDAGRAELVLAGTVSRSAMFGGAMAAVAAGTLLLWVAAFAGSVIASLPVGGSAYLALAIVSPIPVYAGVGAVASQVAPTRRLAFELGGAVVAVSFVLRVIADTSGGAGWLRWLTPLGWFEQLRPFTGAEPLVLVLPVAASVALLAAAARIVTRRDLGTGLLAARDRAAPRLRLLSSPIAQELRDERGSLIVWLSSVGVFGLIVGVISNSISSAGISQQLNRELAKLGSGSLLTPSGYIGFSFIFFVLAVSLFVCAQVGSARAEEADQRLETLLALPVRRRDWLGGRLVLATAAAAVISLCAGALTWAGAASAGVSVSLGSLLQAGANCLTVAVLFLGLGSLAYALVPRATAAISYGLVAVAFLWYLLGALVSAPSWIVGASPFRHVGLAPAEPFRPVSALLMVAIGVALALSATAAFARRDLIGE